MHPHIPRYAPQGKRSWGPTRALAGDITPQQANNYVKVRSSHFPSSRCLQPNPSQVFAMIETREAIQNLDSILDLEVGKVKIFYFNSFAGGGRCFSWTRRSLHLFWGLHRPRPAKVSNLSSEEFEDTNWGLCRPWPVEVRTGKYVERFWRAVFLYFLQQTNQSKTQWCTTQSFRFCNFLTQPLQGPWGCCSYTEGELWHNPFDI